MSLRWSSKQHLLSLLKHYAPLEWAKKCLLLAKSTQIHFLLQQRNLLITGMNAKKKGSRGAIL
jgi:hypothetical protein